MTRRHGGQLRRSGWKFSKHPFVNTISGWPAFEKETCRVPKEVAAQSERLCREFRGAHGNGRDSRNTHRASTNAGTLRATVRAGLLQPGGRAPEATVGAVA